MSPERPAYARNVSTWDEAFAERYDDWAAGMTGDVEFYVSLAKEAPDGPIVELAAGDGRVAIPVARATGRSVVGIDLSPTMVERGRARARDAGVDLDLRLADMRELTLDEPAALVYCPFRALLHLPTWADRRRTFERVAECLSPKGRFAWNAWSFDHHLASAIDGQTVNSPVPHTIRYYVGDNRMELTLEDGSKSIFWWATKNEWLGLVDVAELEVEALYGGFHRESFVENSREYVFVTRHRHRP
jgi:ubiquinone/menaquinone biosynthesis C-methylase UbiE